MLTILNALLWTATNGDSEKREKLLYEIIRARAEVVINDMMTYFPDDDQLEEIAENMPPLTSESSDLTDFILELQREYLMKPFMQSYHDLLYQYRWHFCLLDSDKYHKLVMKSGVIQSQIVQIMAAKTNAIISNADLIRSTPSEPTEEVEAPAKTEPVIDDERVSIWFPQGIED